MKIATIINAHNNTDLVLDTIDSVLTYVTNDMLLIYDKASSDWGETVQLPIPKIEGFHHGYWRAPYRNLMYGIWNLSQLHPDSDWYCYTEPDVLFASSEFKEDLEALDDDTWLMANDFKKGDPEDDYSLLELICGFDLPKRAHSVLGCCTFYRGDFIRKLDKEFDFFERFITYTNEFQQGFFPGFESYDFGEHCLPTLILNMGGKIKGLASWADKFRIWQGNFRKYPMRFKPPIDPKLEDFPESSIIHPLKEVDHPLREMYRMKRYVKR